MLRIKCEAFLFRSVVNLFACGKKASAKAN
jgi:hypothetical protein